MSNKIVINDSFVSIPQDYIKFKGFVPKPVIIRGVGGQIDKSDITSNDVLSGRGGHASYHLGNVQFRKIVDKHKERYFDPSNKKIDKIFLASRVVAIVRCLNPPGRFLQENQKTGKWEEIGDEEARKKASQTFRNGPGEKVKVEVLSSCQTRQYLNEVFPKVVTQRAEKSLSFDDQYRKAIMAHYESLKSSEKTLTLFNTMQQQKTDIYYQTSLSSVNPREYYNRSSDALFPPRLENQTTQSTIDTESMHISDDIIFEPTNFFQRGSSMCFVESSALVDEDMNSIGDVSVSDITTTLENCFPDFISDEWNVDMIVLNNGLGESC